MNANEGNDLLFDSTGGWAVVGGVHETNAQRHLNLAFEPLGTGHRLSIVTDDPELREAFAGRTECFLPTTVEELRADVQECRGVWRRRAVDRLVRNSYVFQQRWDLADAPEHRDEVLPALAEAGQRLFMAIFRPDQDDSADAATRARIATVLRRFSATRELRVKVTSPTFFAPWNMVYTGNVYSDPIVKEHFWGYQHVVEHVPNDSGNLGYELNQDPAEPLRLGAYVDTGIDRSLKVACVAPVLDHLATYAPSGLNPVRREHKDKLKEVLAGEADDHILYFCCHADQEGDGALVDRPGRLRLTDPPEEGWITPSDISGWIDLHSLCSRPVVFLNACGGGQFTSTFYRGFGRTFLAKGACSVIGPQTDVPAVLGGEFARQFFQRFFQGGPENRIADILSHLRRRLYDEHGNPLGLLYSLYRGGDVYLHRAVQN